MLITVIIKKINCKVYINEANLNLKSFFLVAQYFCLSGFTLENTQKVQGDIYTQMSTGMAG